MHAGGIYSEYNPEPQTNHIVSVRACPLRLGPADPAGRPPDRARHLRWAAWPARAAGCAAHARALLCLPPPWSAGCGVGRGGRHPLLDHPQLLGPALGRTGAPAGGEGARRRAAAAGAAQLLPCRSPPALPAPARFEPRPHLLLFTPLPLRRASSAWCAPPRLMAAATTTTWPLRGIAAGRPSRAGRRRPSWACRHPRTWGLRRACTLQDAQGAPTSTSPLTSTAQTLVRVQLEFTEFAVSHSWRRVAASKLNVGRSLSSMPHLARPARPRRAALFMHVSCSGLYSPDRTILFPDIPAASGQSPLLLPCASPLCVFTR